MPVKIQRLYFFIAGVPEIRSFPAVEYIFTVWPELFQTQFLIKIFHMQNCMIQIQFRFDMFP